MDTTASSFTLRKNAKRAAEAMIRKGTAPAVEYGIRPSDDGRFEIVWKSVKAAPTSDEAIAAGRLPQKAPVVTSAANPHYQKHFDRLFDLAKAGDWDGVRNYEVKGSNSYSKMVARYRQDLLAVHAASEPMSNHEACVNAGALL